jgi:hypothetical protein
MNKKKEQIMKDNNLFPASFPVYSKRYSLLKACKEEAEQVGWFYLDDFTEFDEQNFEDNFSDNKSTCLYFSYQFEGYEGQPCFALSFCEDYPKSERMKLEIEFDEVIKRIVDQYMDISQEEEEDEPRYATFSFENGLELVIDWETETAAVLTFPETEDGMIRFDLSDLAELGHFIETARP